MRQTPLSESRNKSDLTEMATTNIDEEHIEELRTLLDDRNGVDVFMKYLANLNLKHLLEFYLACIGLHQFSNNDPKLKSIIKAVYRQYLKHEETPWISRGTKQRITEDLANKNYYKGIFDMAKNDVFTYLAKFIYPKFVSSECFSDYKNGISRKQEFMKSQCMNEQTYRKYNPLSFVRSLKFSSGENDGYSSLRASYKKNADDKSMFYHHHQPMNADEHLNVSLSEPNSTQHTFRPVSLHDTEGESCSSGIRCNADVAVDDCLQKMKNRRNLKTNQSLEYSLPAETTHESRDDDLVKRFEIRTSHCIVNQRPLSQTDPKVFATILSAKLEALKSEMHTSMEQSNGKCGVKCNNEHFDKMEFVDETNILDEHCERVFQSGGISPTQETTKVINKLKKKAISLSNESLLTSHHHLHPFRDNRSFRFTSNVNKERSPSEDSKLKKSTRYNCLSSSKSKSALLGSASHSKCSPIDSGILSLRSGPLSTNERVGEWLKSASKAVDSDRSRSVNNFRSSNDEKTTVVYYLPEQGDVPYMTCVKSSQVTLYTFKQLIQSKRLGNCRYFFKTRTDFSDCGVVFQEITDPDEILPLFNNKIVAKVDKID